MLQSIGKEVVSSVLLQDKLCNNVTLSLVLIEYDKMYFSMILAYTMLLLISASNTDPIMYDCSLSFHLAHLVQQGNSHIQKEGIYRIPKCDLSTKKTQKTNCTWHILSAFWGKRIKKKPCFYKTSMSWGLQKPDWFYAINCVRAFSQWFRLFPE